MIDLTKCCVVIPCLPDGMLSESLASYVYSRFSEQQMIRIRPMKDGRYPSVIEMRNMVVRDHVLRLEHFEHFVFFDNDLKPDARLDPMFEIEADIVGATYQTDSPSAWLMPDSVHAAAMRFRREVAVKMERPWFMQEYSADGTKLTCCDCGYFVRKAKELGFSVARAGYSDHGNRKSWCV